MQEKHENQGNPRKKKKDRRQLKDREFYYDAIKQAYYTPKLEGHDRRSASIQGTLTQNLHPQRGKYKQLKGLLKFSSTGDRTYIFAENETKMSHVWAMQKWQKATGCKVHDGPLVERPTLPTPIVPLVRPMRPPPIVFHQMHPQKWICGNGGVPALSNQNTLLPPNIAYNFNNCLFTDTSLQSIYPIGFTAPIPSVPIDALLPKGKRKRDTLEKEGAPLKRREIEIGQDSSEDREDLLGFLVEAANILGAEEIQPLASPSFVGRVAGRRAVTENSTGSERLPPISAITDNKPAGEDSLQQAGKECLQRLGFRVLRPLSLPNNPDRQPISGETANRPSAATMSPQQGYWQSWLASQGKGGYCIE